MVSRYCPFALSLLRRELGQSQNKGHKLDMHIANAGAFYPQPSWFCTQTADLLQSFLATKAMAQLFCKKCAAAVAALQKLHGTCHVACQVQMQVLQQS